MSTCGEKNMSRTRHHGDKNKEKMFGDDWQWCKREPKEWRKHNKHKKRRSAVRHAITQVDKGWGVDEDVLFPLDKRPWIYYW